jgi:muramoyltetrapeptide carboxypeptidase LdcA involved in peptidoglycan recycling
VADLHAAFSDPNVKAVFSVIGGFNCNQLFSYIDWELIRKNPKIFIGYSDTTALQNAMLAKSDLITYSGPAYSTFGQKLYFDYTLENFAKCLFQKEPFVVDASKEWTDDAWYLSQDDRHLIANEGYWVLSEGDSEGVAIGGNLGTLSLLQGTKYFPVAENIILFLEDDDESLYYHFDRQFESLCQTDFFKNVRGIVFGRFQKKSAISRKKMERLLGVRSACKTIPIIANADFGHTSPIFTFPIGGRARIFAKDDSAKITILEH